MAVGGCLLVVLLFSAPKWFYKLLRWTQGYWVKPNPFHRCFIHGVIINSACQYETRNPKPETRKNSEGRSPEDTVVFDPLHMQGKCLDVSGFGFRIS